MTDQNKPRQNSRNEQTVHNPKQPGNVERVDPATGDSAGTIDTNDVSKN